MYINSIITTQVSFVLKFTGDYSLYGDYGENDYGDGAAEAEKIISQVPPEAIDKVYKIT